MTNDQLEEICQRLLDDCISQADFELLEEALRESESNRQHYINVVGIHSLLQEKTKEKDTTLGVLPMERITRLSKKKDRRIAVLASAAILVIMLVIMGLFTASQSDSRLHFATSPGTNFTLIHENGEDSPEEMFLVEGSRLLLTQGVVELTFKSGVQAVIQAPADMTLRNKDQLYLRKGKGWFNVPEEAIGFTVITPELKIVDLGTEFGVKSYLHDEDEVHVFKGRVRVTALNGVRVQSELTTGKAILVRPYGRFIEKKLNSHDFLSKLPDTLPYFHWSFDDTPKDRLAAEGSHPRASSLKVKNSKITSGIGKYGNCLNFNGVDEYIEYDWPGISGDSPRTVSYWVKIADGLPVPYDVGGVGWGLHSPVNNRWKLSISTDWILQVERPGVAVVNMTFGAFWYMGTTKINDGKWHHIAASYLGKPDDKGYPAVAIYVDGKPELYQPRKHQGEDKTGATLNIDTITNSNYSTPLTIGRSLENDQERCKYLKGSLDEIYLIEGVLSADKIKQLYQKNTLSN